jgi:hypothetical protein
VALESTPGPLEERYLAEGLDGLLHQVRGRVFDDLKGQLPRQLGRQLAKAYRRDGLEGAAAWMAQKIPSYPDLFQHSLRAELDRQASLSDSILSTIRDRTGPVKQQPALPQRRD